MIVFMIMVTEGSIYELKVPQLYPSVRRDDTVRKLHVCCINKHLNHYLSIILVYLHAGSLQTWNRQKNHYIPFLFQYYS